MRNWRINPPKFYFIKFWRVNLILVFFFLLGMIILGRLFFIQIIQHEYWKALAQGQQKFFSQIEGERGKIFLEDSGSENNLIPLAINKEWEFIYISPQETSGDSENISEITKNLSQILGIDEKLILAKSQKSDSLFEMIKNKLSQEEVDLLKKTNLPGVYLGTENIRYYPREEFASQVIGFFGGEKTGQYGIEGYYNEILRGTEGFQVGEKSARGYLIKMIHKTVKKGADVILTLDYNIQFMAEKLLREAKENLDFEKGQIIVGDPSTGKIIAMAEFPNFNPNQYAKETDIEIFQNSTIQKIFEPGSVFKPITMAAGLDTQKITPQTKYYDEGAVKIGGYTIRNFAQKAWGEKTMTEVLERSINTGAVFVEKQTGHQTFLKYVEKFGFFEPTEIDLQGEIFSINSNLKKGYEVNFATASFGQGIEMTPIQLFRAFSVIANGGKIIKPYIVEKIIKDEKEIETLPEASNELVISPQTANQLTAMMVNVVEHGYGKEAKIPGYYIAGKTGTAQIPEAGVYSLEKTIQTFVGFAPAFNPRFLILIKLDNPKTKTAEYSAAPVFRELAKYIIDLWQIPPDYE